MISLSGNGEIIKTEKETSEIFNNFFGNILILTFPGILILILL